MYLEARPQTFLTSVHFSPDIDGGKVAVTARLSAAAPADTGLKLRFKTGDLPEVSQAVAEGAEEVQFEVPIPNARLWSLDDPFLYEVEAALRAGDREDRVETYFGMRKISVVNLPGTEHPYIALNNQPVYLQMSLDQSYHPEGFYTFPSDAFMRDEILRSRRIGLNANRLHVKIDVPRKLYWADRLGLLLMCDVPNSWGEPDAEMRGEIEHALRGMIRAGLQSPLHLLLGAVQRDLGAVHQAGRRSGPTCRKRRSGSHPSTAWPSNSTRRGWSRTTRPATTTTSRPTSTAGTPTCPATSGASTWTR